MLREARLWLWLGFALVMGWLLYLLAPVLTPFLCSALLAYLGDPIVDRIDRWQTPWSRAWAVVATFSFILLVLLLLLLFLIPSLIRQVNSLLNRLPVYLDWLQTQALPWLQNELGIDPALLDFAGLKMELLNYLSQFGGLATGLMFSIGRSSLVVVDWLISLVLVPVVTFYLLRDWDILMAKIRALLPRSIEPGVVRLALEADEVLRAFFLGQFMVMLSLGMIYASGLFAVGLDFALLIGMLAGLVSFVPYLGFIVGIVVAGIAAVLQFHDVYHLLLVFAVFGIGQLVEGMVLIPLLVGERIGLHPVAVIFAVMAGGHLFGFFGVLLALPVAAVIMVLLRHTHDEYLKSVFYDDWKGHESATRPGPEA